jgi:hypothetical protein
MQVISINELAAKHDAECTQGEGLSIDLCPCDLAREWRTRIDNETDWWENE